MNKILHITVNDNNTFSESAVMGTSLPGQHAAEYYVEWQNQGFSQFVRSVVQTNPPGVRFNQIVFNPAEAALWRLQQILSGGDDILRNFLDNVMSYHGDRLIFFEGAITGDYSDTFNTIAKAVFAHINSEEFHIVRHPNQRRHHIQHIRNAGRVWHHLHHGGRG